MAAADIDSINHVGMAVRDLAVTAAQYEAMGFQLTPYSPQSGAWKPGAPIASMASGNRCVMFAENYLEILASEDPAAPAERLAGFLKHHEGAHIICFNSEDLASVDRRITAAGMTTSGVIPLQRDIDTPAGVQTAKFERVQFAQSDSPEGYIQAARHLTPEYIYQARYIEHANACYELADAVIVTDETDSFARKYAVYTGQAPERDGDVLRFRFARLSTLTLVDVKHAAALLPGTLFPPSPGIAGVTFRTRDIGAARTRLMSGGFAFAESGGRLIVPAEQVSGVAVVFEPAP
jgi:Glyoxalase-like domain